MATTYSYGLVSIHNWCQEGDCIVSLQVPVDVKAGHSALDSVCCVGPWPRGTLVKFGSSRVSSSASALLKVADLFLNRGAG